MKCLRSMWLDCAVLKTECEGKAHMSTLCQTAIMILAAWGCSSFDANDQIVLAQSAPKRPDPIAVTAIKKIEGVYKTRFANSTVHDEHFTSENILEIVPYGGDKIYFRVHLEFY